MSKPEWAKNPKGIPPEEITINYWGLILVGTVKGFGTETFQFSPYGAYREVCEAKFKDEMDFCEEQFGHRGICVGYEFIA